MECRVGITTNPANRKAYWESKVVGFANWQILVSFATKQQAQDYEDRYARQTGCMAHAGGPETPGTWYVYRFDYTREK